MILQDRIPFDISIALPEDMYVEQKSELINIKMLKSLKNETDNILSRLGLSFSSVITLFLTQVIAQKKIPFELTTIKSEVEK